MNEPTRDVVLDHNYDGIQEYDNPTPGWWWWLFHLTTAFSIVYFVFFQFSKEAWTLAEEHDAAVARNLRQQFGEIGTLQADEATLLKYMHDERWLAVGRSVFLGRCVTCHGPNGEGLVGPNLTDDAYKNVRTIVDIATVIANGAANNAMPGWKQQLHPNEIVLTAAYIASLRGRNLPGPRGAEGDVIPPWPKAPAGGNDSPPAESAAPGSAP